MIILYVSRVSDTLKMFMPQRLNVWEWEWEEMGIDHVGMGGNGNVKSHSRLSLVLSVKRCRLLK